jgi:hypothetical protein
MQPASSHVGQSIGGHSMPVSSVMRLPHHLDRLTVHHLPDVMWQQIRHLLPRRWSPCSRLPATTRVNGARHGRPLGTRGSWHLSGG